MIVESVEPLSIKNAKLLGKTTALFQIEAQQEILDLMKLQQSWLKKLDPVFPHRLEQEIEIYSSIPSRPLAKKPLATQKFAAPRALIAAFYGTNSEYDMQNAFLENGAKADILLFRNLNQQWIKQSTQALVNALNNSQIFVLPGGFSAGDEPDGAGKFITSVLKNFQIREAIDNFLARGGLILGICNGFQALIKSGLLGEEKIWDLTSNSPTLTFNPIGRHISQMVSTKIVNNHSPWLTDFNIGDVFDIPVSHGEGRFYADEITLKRLITNGQIATQYVNLQGEPTNEFCFNPNGSSLAIEGITSPCGQIFGKMGHSERYSRDIFKNCHGKHYQNIFANGVNYFK
ncbi:MAG: phosphoribosylformylglycinamidine synthase subunit PurQ [Pasteurella sp.]|nr:phosphoribosylformylglycinamidine synthase subunit PurQ [Pasteurella sp.]